tara:strand:+ start:3371 stop:3886 length:516 start_codon:yes stop_codon:yes gene_type:complete
MHILGIDPGTRASGLVLFDMTDGHVKHADKAIDHDDLMCAFYNERLDVGGSPLAGGLALTWDQVVIECLSPAGQVIGHDTFDTIFWVGRMFEAARGPKMPGVELLTRNEIKKRLLGRTNIPGADKHIRQVLVDQVGPKGTKREPGPTFGCSSHSWAALAAVWAYLHPDGVS